MLKPHLFTALLSLAFASCSSESVVYAGNDADPYPAAISKEKKAALKTKYLDSIDKIEASGLKARELLKIAGQLKDTIVTDFEEKRRSLYEAARYRRDRYHQLTRGQPAYEITGGKRKQLPEAPQGAGHFKWTIDAEDTAWEPHTVPKMVMVKYGGDERMTIEQQPKRLGQTDFYIILPKGGQSVVVHSFGIFKLKSSEIKKLVAVEVAEIRKLLDEAE